VSDANPADAGSDAMNIAQRHVGTAGWSIPSSYANKFPEHGSHLERYASRLNAVEINSSFSKSHRRQTYEKWRNAVAADFRFSVKVPRAITHVAGLEDCQSVLEQFANEVAGLGEKLAVILVQLPPKRTFDEPVVERFFKDARSLLKAEFALEPRHASWFTGETKEFLAKLRVACVAADPAKYGDGEPSGWDGLVYYRLHGAPRTYYSDYDQTALAEMRSRLTRGPSIPTWCIFDNTAAGAALGNALGMVDRSPR
jgi:uncharacterized protein YecE (DUF72 family)